MTFEETRERVIAVDIELDRLKEEKTTLLEQLRERCVHWVIIETPGRRTCEAISPPCRICLICGLEEASYCDGNYQELVGALIVRTILSCDEFYSYRRLRPPEQIAVSRKLLQRHK